jgi:hypothetical protein
MNQATALMPTVRRTATLGSAIVLFWAALAFAGSPAVAMPTQPTTVLTCPMAAIAHLTPGLSFARQRQTLSTDFRLGSAVSPGTPCQSAGSGGILQGATGSLRGSGTLSCLGGSGTGSGEMRWNDGEVSAFTWTARVLTVLPIATITIVRGPLQDAQVTVLNTPSAVPVGNCVSAPVSSVEFVGIAVFSGGTPPSPPVS